jgi:hypothetical protein
MSVGTGFLIGGAIFILLMVFTPLPPDHKYKGMREVPKNSGLDNPVLRVLFPHMKQWY